jgi:Transposase
MGFSRRKFTKEFKLAAVRLLETGASMAEVARACEVNPNVCIAGGGSCATVWIARSPDWASGSPRKAKSLNWSVKSASKPWKSIF